MLPDIIAKTWKTPRPEECPCRRRDQTVESEPIAGLDRIRDEDWRGPGSLDGREGRPRKLGLMTEHNIFKLVTIAAARGGSHVHVKWLQDHKGGEVRCHW